MRSPRRRGSAAFDEFFNARYDSLVYSIYLACGDRAAAEDAVQEAFVRAWGRWDHLETNDPVGWVRTVAWRIWVDAWRSQVRYRGALRFLRQKQLSSEAADAGINSDVQAAMAVLSPPLRHVEVLFYVEDMTIDEVSNTLGIPLGTVKSRLSRVRQGLRALIEEDRMEEMP